MKEMHELKFTIKYAGKKLDLSTEHLYPKAYEGHNMGDICLSAEYTVAVLEFSESLKEFEECHAYNTFTTNMDVEPNLSQLFMYMLNAYQEKDNTTFVSGVKNLLKKFKTSSTKVSTRFAITASPSFRKKEP